MQTWATFKVQTGNGRFDTAFYAIDAAVKRLKAQHDGDVASVVLFGSLARQRSTYDDIYMLIVTESGTGSTSEMTRRLAETIFGPLFLEYGELFSFIVYTREQLAKLQDALPLLGEIRREGVLLYGCDPFTGTAGASVSSRRHTYSRNH
jgi:predicted nucleotidyltransferase